MRVRWSSFLFLRIFVLRLELVSENLWVRDELLQELRVRDNSFVDLVQSALVTQRGEQLLVCAWNLVDVLAATVVRRELRHMLRFLQ